MQIQYVSRYIELSREGLVPQVNCPMDQGPLFSNLDKEDQIFLYCISCEYKKTIGISFYNNIVKEVNKNDGM